MFLVNGVGWASWAARLPAIQERLAIGEGAVGAALLGATLGLFVSVVATSVLVERFGSRRVTMASGATMIAALPLIGWAPSFPMLAAALVIYGDANGAFDLAINSQAVTVERAYGRPMMCSLCVLLAEGSVTDWSAIYLSSVVGTGPGLAAAGLIVFSLTMMLGRLFGDRLTLRLGPARLVRGGAVVAATGLALTILIPTVAMSLTGFALVGLGLSIIFPVVLSASGRVPAVRPATGLAGPPRRAMSASSLDHPSSASWLRRAACGLPLGWCWPVSSWRGSWHPRSQGRHHHCRQATLRDGCSVPNRSLEDLRRPAHARWAPPRPAGTVCDSSVATSR